MVDGNPFAHPGSGRMNYRVQLKFLALPQVPICNMTVVSSFLGKTIKIVTTTPNKSEIRYRVSDGPVYDGKTLADTAQTSLLDGGTTTGTSTSTVNVGTSSPSGTEYVNLFTSDPNVGYVYLAYESSSTHSYTTQVILDANNQLAAGYRFIGWFSDLAATGSAPSVDSFVTSNYKLTVTEGSAADQYVARYVASYVSGSSSNKGKVLTVTEQARNVETGEITFKVQYASATGVKPLSCYYKIRLHGLEYETTGSLPTTNNSTFVMKVPVSISDNVEIVGGLSKAVWGSRTVTAEDRMTYLASGSYFYSIPWIN